MIWSDSTGETQFPVMCYTAIGSFGITKLSEDERYYLALNNSPLSNHTSLGDAKYAAHRHVQEVRDSLSKILNYLPNEVEPIYSGVDVSKHESDTAIIKEAIDNPIHPLKPNNRAAQRYENLTGKYKWLAITTDITIVGSSHDIRQLIASLRAYEVEIIHLSLRIDNPRDVIKLVDTLNQLLLQLKPRE